MQKVSLAPVSILKPVYPPRPAPQAMTPRAEVILNEIETMPGHTVSELSDILNESAAMIHAVLLYTELGRWIATTGKVALSYRGSRPRWFRRIPAEFQALVPVKASAPQLALPALSKNVPVEIADNWKAFGDDLVRMLCQNTTSPRVRRDRLETLAQHISLGVARELAAADAIQTALPSPRLDPIFSLAAPIAQIAPKKPAARRARKVANS